MTSLPTLRTYDDYVTLINENNDPKIEKFRADLLKLVAKLRKLREEKLPQLDLHSEIVAWIRSPTDDCPELRLVCSTCYVHGKPNASWSLGTLKSTSKKVSDHCNKYHNGTVDNRTEEKKRKQPATPHAAVSSTRANVAVTADNNNDDDFDYQQLPVNAPAQGANVAVTAAANNGADYQQLTGDALAQVAKVVKRTKKIDRLPPNLSLNEYIAAMETAMDAHVNGVLTTFLNATLGNCNTTDNRLLSFPRDQPTLLDWLRRGQVWASMCTNTDTPADRVHDARRYAINSVFFAINAALNEASLDLDVSLVGDNDFALSAGELRNSDVVTVVRGRFQKAADRSFACARSSVAMALVLDAFFALFHDNKPWVSKRHWQLMWAAVEAGQADANVAAFVNALAGTEALPARPELEAFDSVGADVEEAMPTAEMIAPRAELTSRIDIMMNKRYQIAFALVFDADDMTRIRLFNMPMFFWEKDGIVNLCCVDLTRMPLTVQRI